MAEAFVYYRGTGWSAKVKSRTGCTTCKIRKVKCDEAKPQCVRCKNTGRRCTYALNQSDTRIARPSTLTIQSNYPLCDFVNHESQERRAFEYYFHRAGPAIGGYLDHRFWRGVVPELCRSEPAVWDAVVAISAFFEDPDPFIGPPMVLPDAKLVRKHTKAVSWYSRSMARVRQRVAYNDFNPHVALITCVLYICIETLQGHVVEALQLYEQGVHLIMTLRHSATMPYYANVLREVITPMFFRLGSAAMISGGYPVRESFRPISVHENPRFATIAAAQTAVIELLTEAFQLGNEAARCYRLPRCDGNTASSLKEQQCALTLRLDSWERAFSNLKHREMEQPSSSPNAGAVSTLLTYHTVASTMVSTCLADNEMVYDAQRDQFRQIVQHATSALSASNVVDGAQPPFTFETGIGLPLFYTAVKCRDRYLRREALNLLRRAPPVQAFFKCAAWAALAETIISVEEDLVPASCSWILSTIASEDKVLASNGPDSVSYNLPNTPCEHQIASAQVLALQDDGEPLDGIENSPPDPSMCEGSIPEHRRVRDFGVFLPEAHCSCSADGSGRYSEQITQSHNQIFIRFTRRVRDGSCKQPRMAECFLPMKC
ncbi:C6 finger domain protein [Aspergillus bombycis]|uniref:C6 finger domain protein n=1 Tax=Aspergillus bombycis TaxID=109264 RepID=A0A1F8AGZ1_9EURO|nr:C6 finger domain protein [Aspergillus bombycis]OGM51013.1 C6 finger domain protein [Aspergillus bombycis]